MERYDIKVTQCDEHAYAYEPILSRSGDFVLYADAQRTLDAERDKVKAHNTYLISCPWCFEKMEPNATLAISHLIGCGDAQLATLQAQLRQVGEDGKLLNELVNILRHYVSETGVSEGAVDVLKRKLGELSALRQLVEALPLYDTVRLAQAQNGGWFIYNGGFSGPYKQDGQAMVDLLAYRAALATQAAGNSDDLTEAQIRAMFVRGVNAANPPHPTEDAR